ncbi:MAG TPA: DNA polymerase, partial [Chloroflexota bacterium]|nr:DNA polymerase [Chloroflexota bacterium]
MTQPERLVLVDGNALVHRAFHAIGPLMTSRGELVNATFGFASMLLTSLQMIKPACVAVAFDMAAPTFRKQQFDAYKAHRPRMPSELAAQFPRVRQIVEVLGIPIYETPEFEADDVLGTLSVQAVAQGLDVTIVTGDLDALQLVNEHVTVLINRRGVQDTMQYDPAAVLQRFGFSPLQLPDYKALVGDTSDNIPKVPGIGEKTASDLIARYGDVEAVLAHLGDLKPRQADVLAECADQVRQSKVLATIRRDAPVSFERERCVLADYDRSRAREVLLELEFRSLLGKLPASDNEPASTGGAGSDGAGRQVAAPSTLGQASLFPELDVPAAPAARPEVDASLEYTIVRREEQLRAALVRLMQAPAIAFDVETTAPDEIRSELVGVSLSPASHIGYYVPVGHRPAVQPGSSDDEQLSPEQALQLLRPLLEDATLPKYAHNAKFDVTVLARYGVAVQGLTFDTMVAGYLLNQRGLGLKDMAQRELGVEMTQITDLIGKGSKQISMADVDVEAAGYYACADVDLTYRLVAHLQPQLQAQDLERLNNDIEVPLIGVLSAMELEGVAIDLDRLQQLSHDIGAKLVELERSIVALAGHTFNINSTQQLAKVLFEELKLPSAARTKTGYSTSSDVLELLRGR